jgi:alkaline phosphatase D
MEITRRGFLALTSAAVGAACGQTQDGTRPDVADGATTADDVTADLPTPAVDAAVPEDRPVAVDAAPAPDVAPDAVASPDVATVADDAPAPDAGPDVATVADAGPDVATVTDAGPDVATGADAGADVATGADAGSDVPTLDATMMLPELGSVFPLGLMAGDMDATSAVLWTRFTGVASLALRVERMVASRPVETAVERELTPGPDGFTHALVEGLTPGARYRAVFLTRDGGRVTGRSSFVRFRAALADGALEVVTLGATSCTNALYRPFAPLQRIGDQGELDGFVHLGDIAYCDGSRTLDEFRAKYAQNYTSEGFRRMFREAGFYSTWDDHEVDNNWDPERVNATTFANARRAYFEHRAQRRHPTEPDRLWRSFRWGATLELFILDARGERRPSTRTTRTAQYLSRAQMDWLKDGLARSTARFKVVANSVPIANMPFTFGGGDDRWEGYASARDEILDHITGRSIRGVWWLSGDFHLGAVGKLESSGARSAMRDIIAGPGGQFPNPLFLSLLPSQFEFTTGENNTVTLRADPVRNELTVRFINGAGRVIFERAFANP